MAEDGGIRVQFWYDSEDVDIQPDYVFAYAPWAEDFNGTTEETYNFKVPPATSGGEIEINAAWWNAEPCLVIWKYQAQEVSGTADEDIAPDQVEEPIHNEPIQEVGLGREFGEAECARMQQEVADNVGDADDAIASDLELGIIGVVDIQYGDSIHDYCVGGEDSLSEGSLIKIGDCVRIGPNGRLRIIMHDGTRSGIPPSALNLGENTELCFDEFSVDSVEGSFIHRTMVWLKTGGLRVITGDWQQNFILGVKAGWTMHGIRGSEVFITYVPSDDLVYTMVLEGHMDVTSEATGETVSLTDNQSLVVADGNIIDTGPISQEQWDSELETFKLRGEDFPDVEIEEWEIIAEDIPKDGNGEDKITIAQETRPPLAGYIFILCSVLICGVAIVTILTIVYFVRKQSKQ